FLLFGCIDRATIKGTSLGENMATGIDISEFIVASPDICNARPRIAGTRITIQSLVMDHKTGMSAEAIAKEYPQLSLAQIYSALAYYHANKEQIEADIDAYRADCEDWESRYRAGEL
ncbi:MAG: DUF433 domain-containing protein, partial [Microcystis sp. M53600_WE12]|nr:DUF433 domain-containing protein [Microcystis sp. M53600_WE12]